MLDCRLLFIIKLSLLLVTLFSCSESELSDDPVEVSSEDIDQSMPSERADSGLSSMEDQDAETMIIDASPPDSCSVVDDFSGRYIMGIDTVLLRGTPLLFLAEVRTALSDESNTISMFLQPIDHDGSSVEACGEAASSGSSNMDCSSQIESGLSEIDENGHFELTFSDVVIPAEANSISGHELSLEFTMFGQLRSNGTICGQLSGALILPWTEQLEGSSVALVYADSDSDQFEIPIRPPKCESCSGEDTPVLLDEHAPIWPIDAHLDLNVISANRISLRWTSARDESEITRYLVHQNEELIATTTGGDDSIQVGPLDPNRLYRFKVLAEDSLGNVSISGPEIDVTLSDVSAPSFERDATLEVVQTGPNSLHLNWSAASDNVGVSKYELYQDYQVIAEIDASLLEWTVEGVIEGNEYLYSIEALDAVGNTSIYGPFKSIMVEDRSAPLWSEPAQVWATNLGEETFRLNWTSAFDVDSVWLYRVRQSSEEIALIPAPQQWVNLEGFMPYTSYVMQVIAEDLSGNLSTPLGVTVTTDDQTAPLWSDNAALLVRNVSGDSATISWSQASDNGELAGYLLFRNEIEVANVPADQSEVNITGFSTLVDYALRVEAYDQTGNYTTNGPRLLLRLDDANPPSWPSDARLSLLSATPTSAQLSWTAAIDDIGISGYELSIDDRAVAVTDANTLSAELTSLMPNASITVQVNAIDGAGNLSSGPTLQIDLPDYDVPQWPLDSSISMINLTTSSVEFSWSEAIPSPEIEAYVIFLDDVEVASVDLSNNFYTLNQLPPNRDLTIRIELRGPTGHLSPNGPELQVRTLDFEPPVWPENASIQSTELTETTVKLTWTQLESDQTVISYEIYQDAVMIGTIDAPQRTFTVANLQAITTYVFKVEAIGPIGQHSLNGPQLQITTPDLTGPTWPVNSQITVGRITQSSIELSWPEASDQGVVLEYEVQSNTGLSWRVSDPMLLADQLSAASQFTFTLNAFDQDGNSSATALMVSAQTAASNNLSDENVYNGLRPHCSGCHDVGSSSPYFGSLQQFQDSVVNDSSLISFGDPDSSLFILVLEGNGEAPWDSMPLGARNYSQMVQRGEATLSMSELRTWVQSMGGN